MALLPAVCLSQTKKQTTVMGQTWLGAYNQTRFSNRWGMWFDAQLYTREHLVKGFFQTEIRPGITYYLNDSTKLTQGYCFQDNFPFEGHKNIAQPEHRLWQQIQWHTRYPRLSTMQYFRLEERWVRKIANDSTLAPGSTFTFRMRYNFSLTIPIFVAKKQTPWSISISDEAFVNFGKNVVYNYFDQNRVFIGATYRFNAKSNLQVGYLNVFQELGAGNKYRMIHAPRIYYFTTFDLRKKK